MAPEFRTDVSFTLSFRAVLSRATDSLRFLPMIPDDVTPLRTGQVDLALGVFPELPPYAICQVRRPRVDKDASHAWLRKCIADVTRREAR